MAADELAQRAILDEGLKKGALVWLQLGSRSHARWYAWADGHVYLLTGRDEQPDPGVTPGEPVRVVVRSKDNRHRMLAFDADVSRLLPADADWSQATSELAKARLNLSSSNAAGDRWSEPGFVLYRLDPRLPLAESPADAPGDTPDASHRQAPVPTAATTANRQPWVLHKRGGSGRALS